ncbi:MAG: phosphoribulokinase, partial [Candidatus Limnocylindria bacterium]
MSATHPVIAITGSSGAGTTSVSKTFEQIFRREKINAVFVEGDAFHRYDRAEMAFRMDEESTGGNQHFSHFGAEANLFAELEQLFRDYGENAGGRMRRYLHTDEEGQAAGTFTAWEDVATDSELLFYEGLHGAVVTDGVDVARHVDLLIGVVPVINLEWIQKLHRDRAVRAHTTESVTETILRRMPDYLNFIVPQFTKTHINFQRVPVVDTSNP